MAMFKSIFIKGCVLAAMAVFILFINACTQNKSEIYSDGSQKIELSADGKFTAVLSHNNRKSGTYIKKSEGNSIIVSFNVNGTITVGRIINDALHFPEEWEDRHHHGNILPKL